MKRTIKAFFKIVGSAAEAGNLDYI